MNQSEETLRFPVAAAEGSDAALISFVLYLIVVVVLAWFASHILKKRSFVSEYFLGSRTLGMWAFALSFAATNASGGSFMGFPALIYTHGWVLALWIASYMMVPLVTMGLLAKRLNQVARKAGAITVPEVLRERFDNAKVGLTATFLLIFFLFFYLLAQFKAGSTILATLLADVPLFQSAVGWVAQTTEGVAFLGNADPDYLLCLVIFAGAVIAYTAYGGFRAVVWTDVLQGLVMFIGVAILLGLVLAEVGGLSAATKKLAGMKPPLHGEAVLELLTPQMQRIEIAKGTWLPAAGPDEAQGVVRLVERAVIGSGSTKSAAIPILKVLNPENYTQIDTNQVPLPVVARIQSLTPYEYGAEQEGGYVTAPGPDPENSLGFLSMGMALSFFVFWAFAGAGQPSNMVRQMAFKDSATLKRSLVMVTIYYSTIYFFLVLIFCCSRVFLPGMEINPDRVMPETARYLTLSAGVPWLAGLLVAAPFAAVMSSVDSFLLMVSSGLVRDLYQRVINPRAPERRIRHLTYWATTLIGLAAVLAIMNPPRYLQNLIIFASGGLAGCFLIPVGLSLFWSRINGAGTIAGMLGGCGTHLVLYIIGYMLEGRFTVYQFLGVQPFIWDVAGSALCCIGVSLATRPPKQELVDKFFNENYD